MKDRCPCLLEVVGGGHARTGGFEARRRKIGLAMRISRLITGLIAGESPLCSLLRSPQAQPSCPVHVYSVCFSSTTSNDNGMPEKGILESKTKSFLVFAAIATFIVLYQMYNLRKTTPPTAGWHARAQSSPSLTDFSPNRDTLQFALLRSSPAEPEGFTLALFSPDIAVDATGRVYHIQASDFTTLTTLSSRTLDLPQTESFMNTWRIKRPTTSQPIQRLYVANSEGKMVVTSVYGFPGGEPRTLATPVAEYTELPSGLTEFLSLALEAREGNEAAEVDRDTIAAVITLVRTE